MRYGWSLNAELWQTLSKAVHDYDWQRAYLESDYTNSVPNSSGVYLICASTSRIPIRGTVMERLYNAIYVGQTKNLKQRFRAHIRGYRDIVQAKNAFRRLDFWFAFVQTTDLNEIEQLLLDTFGPTANIRNVKARLGEPRPAGRITGDKP